MESLLGERAQQGPNALRLTLVNDVDRAVTEHVTVKLGQGPGTCDRCMKRVVILVPELLVLYREPDGSVTGLGNDLAFAVVSRLANDVTEGQVVREEGDAAELKVDAVLGPSSHLLVPPWETVSSQAESQDVVRPRTSRRLVVRNNHRVVNHRTSMPHRAATSGLPHSHRGPRSPGDYGLSCWLRLRSWSFSMHRIASGRSQLLRPATRVTGRKRDHQAAPKASPNPGGYLEMILEDRSRLLK
jgi:hypothetical protein